MGSDPLLGSRVGSVQLVRKLGAGAMGVVYQGWHEAFAREVAVKFLTATTSNSRERFLREGRSAAKVDHQNVVRILDAGQVSGRAYLVLEYVNGRSLGDILDAQAEVDRNQPPSGGRPAGALPDLGVVSLLGAQMARGLAAIHRVGIVHRDIKPDNVMVSAEGTAKIADLGLAKHVSDPDLLRLTATGMVVGTPLYVSPEGIRDPGAISSAADLYSLGATLYHLVSGRPPFPGSTAYEVMRGHLEAPLRPLHELRAGIDPSLARLIESCLEKKPDARPTAEQLAAALIDRAAPKKNSRWLVGALTCCGALILATAAGGWWWLAHSEPPTTATTTQIASGKITLVTNRPCQIRIDGGPLQDMPTHTASFPAPLGSRRVTVTAVGDGVRWAWSGSVESLASDAPRAKPTTVILSRTTVTPVRVSVPGDGLAYRQGRAYGLDSHLTLTHAGTFHIGRWNGALWTPLVAEVDAAGQLSVTPGSIAQKPGGAAWWIDRDDDGLPVPSHRVVSWYEAEQVRARLGLVAPPGWSALAARPEQPAQQLSPALVISLAGGLAASGGGGQLPNGEQARALAAAVPELAQRGLWSATPDAISGRPTTATLVLVP